MIRKLCLVAISATALLMFAPDALSQGSAKPPATEQPAATPLSPRLHQILITWAQKTSTIERLQGKHTRVIYDEIYKVEKRSRGLFYYEAPDKGRIDVSAISIPEGTKGRPQFTVQSDLPERWICDGSKIIKIDEPRRVASLLSIPAENRGVNMMDGPLPFLFGMPADKAEKRYRFSLIKESVDEVWLGVLPRQRNDAVNWRIAKVILMKQTFLPRAVQLTDPTGNRTTVYQFADIEVNRTASTIERIFGTATPFNPDLGSYKIVTADVGDVAARTPGTPPRTSPATPTQPRTTPRTPTATKAPTMPSLKDYHWKIVKQRFEDAGYTVKVFRGKPAPTTKLVYCVYEQQPTAGASLQKGQTVQITLFDRAVVQTSAKQPAP